MTPYTHHPDSRISKKLTYQLCLPPSLFPSFFLKYFNTNSEYQIISSLPSSACISFYNVSIFLPDHKTNIINLNSLISAHIPFYIEMSLIASKMTFIQVVVNLFSEAHWNVVGSRLRCPGL